MTVSIPPPLKKDRDVSRNAPKTAAPLCPTVLGRYKLPFQGSSRKAANHCQAESVMSYTTQESFAPGETALLTPREALLLVAVMFYPAT